MLGLTVHRCSGRRSPRPPAFLGPASPEGRRPSVISEAGLRCGVQRVPAAGPPACLPRRQPAPWREGAVCADTGATRRGDELLRLRAERGG